MADYNTKIITNMAFYSVHVRSYTIFQWHLPSEPPKKSNLRKNSIRVFPCCNFMNKRMGYKSEGKCDTNSRLNGNRERGNTSSAT